MKSSVMNVQVDVTFYKKTFLFYFFRSLFASHNAAAARVECEAEMCSNVTLLLTILLSSTSTLCVRFESSHFFFMFFNRFSHLFRRRLQHDDAGRKISLWLFMEHTNVVINFSFQDALHVIIYHF